MSKRVQRAFSTDFKSGVIQRIEAGEGLGAVAVKLGIRRKLLYEWRAAYRTLGVAGLNRKRGPKAGDEEGGGFVAGPRLVRRTVRSGRRVALGAARRRTGASARTGGAQARIAELERVIGRQQVDLDFFREALRLMDATPPGGIATRSTRSSKK